MATGVQAKSRRTYGGQGSRGAAGEPSGGPCGSNADGRLEREEAPGAWWDQPTMTVNDGFFFNLFFLILIF